MEPGFTFLPSTSVQTSWRPSGTTMYLPFEEAVEKTKRKFPPLSKIILIAVFCLPFLVTTQVPATPAGLVSRARAERTGIGLSEGAPMARSAMNVVGMAVSLVRPPLRSAALGFGGCPSADVPGPVIPCRGSGRRWGSCGFGRWGVEALGR